MISFALFNINCGNSEAGHPADESHITKLVEAARAGDRESYDEIVFQFRDQVYAAAWNLTRNNDDAMDVSQEAFVRAWNALSSYKGRCRFSTWLHRITLNTGIDYIRREKRHRHDSLDNSQSKGFNQDNAGPPKDLPVAASQREQVYAQELQGQVLAALDQLSARQRQVFLLRYYHELDTRETAKVIKCTEGSVKRHLFRAQIRLRELLRELGLHNHDK